jgi:hypothetical protein
MLDPSSLFTETSGLMSESILGGKPANVIIDKLETLFLGRYEALQAEIQSKKNTD